jgi:PAT family beta-lactamase induction signal transducer AmpG
LAGLNSSTIGMMGTVHPNYFTQQIGWSQERFSQIEGGAGALCAVVGALVGGFLVDRLGVRRIITICVILITTICFGMGLSEELRTSDGYVVFYLLSMQFLISAQMVAGFSLFMRLCSLAVAGTQFTLYMAAGNFARVGGARIVGQLSDEGFAVLFMAMGVAILLSLPALFAISGGPSGHAGKPPGG